MTVATNPIVVTEVTGPARMDFLPKLFTGQAFLLGEHVVFGWMRQLCQAYNGGYWQYFEASNGAMFMAPQRDEKMHLAWAQNWSDELVSGQAAGIVATLFGLCQLVEEYRDEGMVERYHLLRDFAATHPEWKSIYRLID
ncbi:antirestriction protein [Pusillimonas caeni]|uniref:antirestriction protein n=1 Tax=Pusillimonas caeni TaxID=1348472 RepID=UPI000E599A78|nr:antirestriction protein [Pusillimonas caeni]TFL14045.1 antirestriction protein [Pusillimonas caeni]